MAKFRKKPVVIEAYQFNGSSSEAHKINDWLAGANCPQKGGCCTCDCGGVIEIETLEGTHTARAGDWIIKGVQGEFSLCKPTVFEATHEKVSK